MCLLVMAFRLDSEAPLVVAANRDEHLDRRATAMTVLRPSDPRILGGRDEEAGGTWLAVNEYGVVAGLTNRPLPDGRDPAKRTRGELPLALASHRRAADAVEDFVQSVDPAHYNPAWFLVGDRQSLFFIDMTDGPRAVVETLGPGVHVLENNPLDAPSWKVDHVRSLVGATTALHGEELMERFAVLLADHETPEPGAPPEPAPPPELAAAPDAAEPPEPPAPPEVTGPAPRQRRVETLAACVHTEDYGTRSSTLIRVPADPGRPPEVRYAEGHPCTSPFLDATGWWRR